MIYSVHYRARGVAHSQILVARTFEQACRFANQFLSEGAVAMRIYDGRSVVWTGASNKGPSSIT